MVGPTRTFVFGVVVLILGSIHMYTWRLGRRCCASVTAALRCITDEGVVPTQTNHIIELNETRPSTTQPKRTNQSYHSKKRNAHLTEKPRAGKARVLL